MTATVAPDSLFDLPVQHVAVNGVDIAFNVYSGAGFELGDQAGAADRRRTDGPAPEEDSPPNDSSVRRDGDRVDDGE